MCFLFQTHENLGKLQVGLLSMDVCKIIIGIVSNKMLNSDVTAPRQRLPDKPTNPPLPASNGQHQGLPST